MTPYEQQIDILRQRMSEKEIETKLIKDHEQAQKLNELNKKLLTELENGNSIIVSNFKESNFITEKKHEGLLSKHVKKN